MQLLHIKCEQAFSKNKNVLNIEIANPWYLQSGNYIFVQSSKWFHYSVSLSHVNFSGNRVLKLTWCFNFVIVLLIKYHMFIEANKLNYKLKWKTVYQCISYLQKEIFLVSWKKWNNICCRQETEKNWFSISGGIIYFCHLV